MLIVNASRYSLAVAVSIIAMTASMASAETSAPSSLSMLEAMVANGVISQAQADKIIKDAEARDAAKAAVAPAEAPLAAGSKRVTYVPEIVRKQLKDELRSEVLAQAKQEGWATPNQVPEWTQRIKFKGDIRGRYEGVYYPDGNDTYSSDMIDFNSINNGSPLALVHSNNFAHNNIPYHDADQNRERMRLRARLGVDATLGEGFTTGMRIATGSGSDPVSTNQSLGGSGGDFSKYQLWLDRAFIHWDAVNDKEMGVALSVGRFDNPFFGTDLVWDDDLGFDGLALTGRYRVEKGLTPFATLGAFPVYNTALNFSSNQAEKTASHDKWLYGLQAGTDWKPHENTGVKFGASYYHFKNISGKQSSPCNIQDSVNSDNANSSVSCDTDLTRPSFAQHGNTYMALRDLSGTPYGTDNTSGDGLVNYDGDEYQYYGLATPFRVLSLTGRLDYDGLKPPGLGALRFSVDGEFVKNLAFDKDKVAAKAVNNIENGTYDGGDTGYMMRLTVGTPQLAERWDWNASLAYKYLESDAVVDGFTDSDFGMGGTNLKGFILGGNLVLAKNVWTTLRWLSADSIAGAPYSVDAVQADLTARF